MFSPYFTGDLHQRYRQVDGALAMISNAHEKFKVSSVEVEKVRGRHHYRRVPILLSQPIVVRLQVNLNLFQQWLAQNIDRNVWVHVVHKNEVFEQVFALLAKVVALNKHEGQCLVNYGRLLVLVFSKVEEEGEHEVVGIGPERI